MFLDSYITTLQNDCLTIVTVGSFGDNQTLTSLTVKAGNKTVAKSGEKVMLFCRTGGIIKELTLTADLGKTTTMSFSSTVFDCDIPVGTVVLMPQEGMFDKINNTDLYFQQSLYLTTGTNGNDYLSAFGTSTFSVNSGTDLADGNSKPNRWASQFSIFVAPFACTIKKIKGWATTDSGLGDDAVISIWTATPNAGTTTNLTIDLVHSFTITSRNNQNHLFDLEQDTSAVANAQLAEGDIVFVSIRRTGSKNSGVKYYADLGFTVEMFKQPI